MECGKLFWQHARRAWIEFYADRWAGFWGKMVGALHKAGKKAVINSVSEEFLRGSAAAIRSAAGGFAVLAEEDSVNLMVQEQPDGTLRVAIKNKTHTYARPTVDLRRPIESIEVLTRFPSVLVRPQGSRFTVRVPGKGITVLSVKLRR